ncbi:MAG: hypothetical protein IIY07_05120 [Thermoguttaceae bacterium]|nr:hypothetical protein [Thermoguttaceae bacterium]
MVRHKIFAASAKFSGGGASKVADVSNGRLSSSTAALGSREPRRGLLRE